MSKQRDRHYRYNFGRLFFMGESKPIPDEIKIQPLGNHVGNVKRLAKLWQGDNFNRERVVKSADLHDLGKPQKFQIKVKCKNNSPKKEDDQLSSKEENNPPNPASKEGNKKAKKSKKTTPISEQSQFQEYIYSFSGHRFLADYPQNKWAETLAKAHHDFSVGDICRDTYELKKEYADILAKDPLIYARELYILEMCDQIEAELACRIIGDEKQAEERTFMDYTVTVDKSNPNIYYLDPYPFSTSSEVNLNFESWSYQPSEEDQRQLQQCLDQNKEQDLGKTLDKLVKDWWQNQQGNPPKNQTLTITIKPHQSQEFTNNSDCNYWYQTLANFSPNEMQKQAFEQIVNQDNPAFLLKAPTGSGKFEAILFPILARGDRLILPLPARSLIDDQKQRAEKYLIAISKLYPEREFSLVIDTGSQMYRWVYRDGELANNRAKNPRRHLYKGDIILTTIDKFIYRYFAYGDKQKSFIFPLRIEGVDDNTKRTIICFDEAHSYEQIAFTNFHSLVKALYEAGRNIILMTATLPSQQEEYFDYLCDDKIDYLTSGKVHQKGFQWLNNIKRNVTDPTVFQQQFADIIIQEWNNQQNPRIIAVVETVKDAVEIYKKLRESITKNEKQLYLYHGRIADKERATIYQEIKQKDDNNQPYLLVTTSAIEVGCDLNATVLISEISPPENLIQRAGRCNRKGNVNNAKVIVIGDKIQDFANSMTEEGWHNYQQILESLETFEVQTLINCISQVDHIDDYRVVELFTMLHDYVYKADLTCQPTHEKGLVITRSWQPSVTLVYDDKTKEKIAQISHPQITIPIDRLIMRGEVKKYPHIEVFERYYNQEEYAWQEKPLSWGCAYQKDIVIKVNNLDYDYDPELGFVELPKVFIDISKNNGFQQKLLYKPDQDKQELSAIINYIKSL